MPSTSTGDLEGNLLRNHLFPRFWKYRWRFAVALVLVIVHAALPSAIVFLIQGILDNALINKDVDKLFWLPLALIAIYVLNGLVAYTRGMITRGLAWEAVTELRKDVFSHLLTLSPSWRQKQQTGELLSRLMNDISSIQYFASAVITLIHHPLTILGLIASAFYMNAQLAVICLFVLPFVAILIQRFGKRLRGSAQNEFDQSADLQSMTAEALLGYSTIQAAQAETLFSKRFSQLNSELFRRKMQYISAQLLPGPVVETVAAVGIGLAILFGGQQVLNDQLQPGELIAFLVAMGLLNAPFKAVSEAQALWQRASAGAQAAYAILHESPLSDTGRHVLNTSKIEIVIRELDFAYQPEKPVLRQFSCAIPDGQITAICGPSGIGKTSIADLILRRYPFQSGEILVNGLPINQWTRSSLINHMAIIQQEPFIFNATVRDNLLMGQDASEVEMIRAAKSAAAHEFILDLPLGYDTVLNETGSILSGGQRQRICIARAFLRNSPLVILDEATSNLDADSQDSIVSALKALMHDRTVILISHDPRLLAVADNIVRL
ncbi:MAG: ABC transporter ATP-binding protein [Myxococcota bacterium]|nr:ABC transporter ATP-binding protein [Myxococcota bacterium]